MDIDNILTFVDLFRSTFCLIGGMVVGAIIINELHLRLYHIYVIAVVCTIFQLWMVILNLSAGHITWERGLGVLILFYIFTIGMLIGRKIRISALFKD